MCFAPILLFDYLVGSPTAFSAPLLPFLLLARRRCVEEGKGEGKEERCRGAGAEFRQNGAEGDFSWKQRRRKVARGEMTLCVWQTVSQVLLQSF